MEGLPLHRLIHWDQGYNAPSQKEKERGDLVMYRQVHSYINTLTVGSDRLKVTLNSHAPACTQSRRYRRWPRAPRLGLGFGPASQRLKCERRLPDTTYNNSFESAIGLTGSECWNYV